jgi:hypothetical protein
MRVLLEHIESQLGLGVDKHHLEEKKTVKS